MSRNVILAMRIFSHKCNDTLCISQHAHRLNASVCVRRNSRWLGLIVEGINVFQKATECSLSGCWSMPIMMRCTGEGLHPNNSAIENIGLFQRHLL